MSSGFNVRTGPFDGPMDLLLHLIEKNEVDIFDIPIAPITDQYLMYIQTFEQGLDMDALSAFLLMAATLLSIKTRMLAPNKKDETPDEDPRTELVNRLIDFKLFKERAEALRRREKTGVMALYRGRDPNLDWTAAPPRGELVGVVSVDKLRLIYKDVLARRERRTDKVRSGFGDIALDNFTISDRMTYIENELLRAGRMNFSALFAGDATKEEKVVTFLALLELIKQNRIAARQARIFDDIVCERRERYVE